MPCRQVISRSRDDYAANIAIVKTKRTSLERYVEKDQRRLRQ
jgi:hypothetical protein